MAMMMNNLFEEITPSLTDDGKDKEGLFFSKSLVVVSYMFYILIVVCVLGMAFELTDMAKAGQQINNLGGISAALSAMISIPVTLPVTTTVWYLKKTQAGHTAKTQAEVYMVVMDKEVESKKSIMQLQHDLKLTDMEMNKANIQRADSITAGAFNQLDSGLKTAMSDATAQVKKEV